LSAFSDPIADLLTRVRNGIRAAHTTVELPSSRTKLEIVKILEAQGYIAGHEVFPADDTLPYPRVKITLKYTSDRRSAISGLRRVSRPGRRHYVGSGNVPKVFGGLGTSIISTSSGVMTGHDARKAGVGGEVLAEVW
jgi:small subunit ribosomal protein S8